MPRINTPRTARLARHRRVRNRVVGSSQRPRLCIFRSVYHIYAQLIDDSQGHTMAAATTLDAEVRGADHASNKTQRASLAGKLLAQRAQQLGVTQVVFDRGGYKYHGRVKALAEAAREGGLQF